MNFKSYQNILKSFKLMLKRNSYFRKIIFSEICVFSFCRHFMPPQLIYVKMVGNVLSQIALLVSPKNKQTPFAEFGIVKTVGTCWESNLGPPGKQCSVILVLSYIREKVSSVKIAGTIHLLVIVQKYEDVWKYIRLLNNALLLN